MSERQAIPADSAVSGENAGTDLERRAGRGGVAVLGAKAFFIVSGLVQQAGLGFALSQDGYGELARVLAVANVVNNVVVAGSTQGVSRAVAGARGNEAGALRGAVRIHAILAVALAGAFALAAPLVARFQHATEITVPLLVMSGVVLLYGLYAPLVGSLNGRGLFVKQASLDMLFAALRTVAMIGLALFAARSFGSGVLGATGGFVAAAFVILLVAVRLAGLGGGKPTVGTKAYLAGLLPLVLAQLFVNLVMQADIVLLGRYLVEGALASGLTGKPASVAANDWVAVYRACQQFAFLPYQLLLSLTQVLFPMLAQARAAGDGARIKAYVTRGARLGAISTGALVAIIAGAPGSLIHFLFGTPMAEQGLQTLRVLAMAQGVFAMLAVASTVLASVGRERSAAGLTMLALGASVVLCVVLVPLAAFGEAKLVTSAAAVGAGLLLALGVGAWLVRRATGAFVPLATGVRVLAATGATIAVGSFVHMASRFATPFLCMALGGIYVTVLALTREVGSSDAAAIGALIRRRRAAT